MTETGTRFFPADIDDTGVRLDRFLTNRIQTLSRARVQGLIRDGFVTVEGRAVGDPNAKVFRGAIYAVASPAPEVSFLKPEIIPLNVVHEDTSLIVIDKPAGLVVHPGAGNWTGTLANALLAHCGESLSGIGGVARPGIVHRLDKDTSGLMVIAKTDAAHRSLAAQFADHGRTGDLLREYIALVWDAPQPPQGRIETSIGRDPASRLRMVAGTRHGRQAITHYRTERTYLERPYATVMKRDKPPLRIMMTVVRCRLETGRTHQVRVHMSYLGTPIVGDTLYGAGFRTKMSRLPEHVRSAVALLTRQALHAAILQFRHPETDRVMAFNSDLPKDMSVICRECEKDDAKVSKN